MLSIHLICFCTQKKIIIEHTRYWHARTNNHPSQPTIQSANHSFKRKRNWKSRQKLSPIFYTEICTDYVRSMALYTKRHISDAAIGAASPMINDSRLCSYDCIMRFRKKRKEKWAHKIDHLIFTTAPGERVHSLHIVIRYIGVGKQSSEFWECEIEYLSSFATHYISITSVQQHSVWFSNSYLFFLFLFYLMQNNTFHTTTTTTETTALNDSNYRLFKLAVSLVTSSTLQCTSSSKAVVFVVITIAANQYSNHGKSTIDFCASITPAYIGGKNEGKTLLAAPCGCDGCDTQINRISVTVFIMNTVINQMVNPVCCSCCSHGCRYDELFLLLWLVIRRRESYALNVSSVCGRQHYANRIHGDKQSTATSRHSRIHHSHCDVCDAHDGTSGDAWRRQTDQTFQIIYFNQQSIRNGRTNDDAMIACRMREILQLICNLCDNFLTIKLNELRALEVNSEKWIGNFDLNLNLLFRMAAATVAAHAPVATNEEDKLLVYSIICTKHCRRRRGRRRPYRSKCVPCPNGRQLQQIVHWCCHAHTNNNGRCSGSDAITNNPYDVFMCPFNNNNSIYCQQAYVNGLQSLAKPFANNVIDDDPMSLPRSGMNDCDDPNGYLLTMKSFRWINTVKLHSISTFPTSKNAICVVETSTPPSSSSTSSIPIGQQSGITLLSMSSNAHEFATQANATISTMDAVSTIATSTAIASSMALNQSHAVASTKTSTVLAANQRISRINGPHGNNNAGCCTMPTTTTTSSSSSSTGTTYLKRHLYLLLIALLTCCVPFASATSMHNLKYSTNVVKTKYGQLRGIVVRSNPTVEAYLGVPYATPPVGSLR